MRTDPGRKRLNPIWRATAWVVLALFVAAAGTLPVSAFTPEDAQTPAQRFEGYLKAQGPDPSTGSGRGKWLIGDFGVLVDQETVINQKRGPATVGAWLIVWVSSTARAGLHADLIYVDRPAGQTGPTVQFTDRLNKKIDPSNAARDRVWMIGPTPVLITPATVVIGDPQVDDLVWVMAEQKGTDLWAISVEEVDRTVDAVPVEFEGVIEQIGVTTWQIAGRQVLIEDDTEIIGDAAVGKSAEVKALQAKADSTLTGRTIRVLDQGDELTLGAMVASILPAEAGATVWDVWIFAEEPGAYPTPTTLYVNGNTLVDESRAVAKAGQWAEVRGLSVGQDEYKADMIRLEEPVPVTIAGDAELASAATAQGMWWRIGGQLVWVPRQVASTIDPERKEGAAVQGVLLGNGVVWARQLQVSK